jgi:hypothetical protein
MPDLPNILKIGFAGSHCNDIGIGQFIQGLYILVTDSQPEISRHYSLADMIVQFIFSCNWLYCCLGIWYRRGNYRLFKEPFR